MNITKIFLSFTIVVIVAISSAIFTITKMNELSINTQRMYTHPFKVSNAIADIQTSIIVIHRNIKDIVLTSSNLETVSIIEAMQQEEEYVLNNFKLIYSNYLGNKKDIDTAYNTFKMWKIIRQKTIALIYQNNIEEANNINKGEGAEHIKNLYKQIAILKDFANNKASEFYEFSIKNSGVDSVVTTFVVTLLFSSLIIIYIIISLLKINKNNNKQLYLIDQNILTAKLTLNREVIEISNAFCRILNVQKNTILHTKKDYFFTDKEQFKQFETKIYSGKEHSCEIYITVDKEKIWFVLEIFPEFDTMFNLSYFNIFLTNITDKKKIEEVSIKDTLTGLYNRNYFEMIFEKEVRRSKRDKKPLSVVMLDVDFFKQFNDSYGHQEGDRALKAVAHVLAAHTNRSYDYAFRVGGEEFVILSYQKDFQALGEFVKIILNEVESLKISHKNSGVSDYLTVSAGTVLFGNEHLLNTDDMYKSVDTQLYEAKSKGRNTYKGIYID